MVWYFHLFKNFPQFVVIHTVKDLYTLKKNFFKYVNIITYKGKESEEEHTCIYIYFFSGGSVVKNPPANAGDAGSNPWGGKNPWKRKWQPTPVFLPGKFHG